MAKEVQTIGVLTSGASPPLVKTPIVLMFGFPICNILQLLIHTILNLAFILIHLKKFFNSLCYIPNDLTRIFSFPYRFSRSNNKFSSPETI